MGKGDKKSKKGKRFLGSYGIKRKQKSKVTVDDSEKPKTPKPVKEVKEVVEEKVKAPKKEAAAEAKPAAKRSTEQGEVKAPKKEAAEKKEAAPKAAAKKKTKEE